ncbi:kynureninase [Streptomyces sp. DSM 15324]|uniref:kynureninase n=1 Tax=Streptomyces sp. DSM 15324 TaxID=1739111 RepID=UPI0007486229|nr:kynureninase [Streptomyces sp. DSM 15324]KUO08882.1 kynureninase [Streptomyces sp. DSM 15324]
MTTDAFTSVVGRFDGTRDEAERYDRADPLGFLRDRFVHAEPDLIYLDGNSLGRLPAATADFVADVVRDGWGRGLIRSWNDWIDWSGRIGDRLAAHVLGAGPGEVALSDSTTVNLYKLAWAALDLAPHRHALVVDADDFPTNRYVAQGLARQRGLSLRLVHSDLDRGMDLERLRAVLDDEVALVILSHVAYRSGALADMAAVNAMAREAGALVLWDLSHAAGAVPVRLTEDGADLAVGCTYKYLNGGPGSPAFLYVRRPLQRRLRQPVQGWFGQRDQFAMAADFDPVEGIDRFLTGTPPMLSTAALVPALGLVEEAGVDRLRAKGRLLGELAVDLAARWLASLGFRLASPEDPDGRGSHITLWHPEAWRICRALADEAGVVCDYREPDRLRIGPSPAYTRFTDVWDALDRTRRLVDSGRHTRLPREKARIT